MTVQTLCDVFARAAFVNRYPSVTEYAKAAPVEQRAILARWKELTEEQKLAQSFGYRGMQTIYPQTHEEAMRQAAKRPRLTGRNYDDAPLGDTQTENENGMRSYGDQVGE